MPAKKKAPIPKTSERGNLPELSADQDGANGQTALRVTGSAPPRTQMESFGDGMRLFHARQLGEARELFLAASGGPDRAVSHRAALHARMCESRLESSGVILSTPEDHYNYAITLINSRNFSGALEHLRAALEAEPSADHVLYALAACQGLTGDLQGAYENLKRAIDLQPRNRLAARQDPDFASFAGQTAFSRLLYPDKKN
jgi:tetratricopeptide (TPR) repeat protein